MRNRAANFEIIRTVAKALGDINAGIAYVGGAVIGLYADEPGAEDVRPTKDIDIVVQVATINELSKLEEDLAERGFSRDPFEEVICRFKFVDILVDVMSTKEVAWAPSNRWFKSGVENLQRFDLGDIEIQILNAAYFLATKFEAYNNRGHNDPRTSPDFEDIVYVLDNNMKFVEQVINSPGDLKDYLIAQFKNIAASPSMLEAVEAHLSYETRAGRLKIIRDKLNELIHV